MADSTSPASAAPGHDPAAHAHDNHVPLYLKIFVALLVLTVLEYFYAYVAAERGFLLLVVGLMAMAVTKAVLVGMYFMHLKFEGRWVYYMLVPAGILAMVFIFALYPDIGRQESMPSGPAADDDDFSAAPFDPAAARRA